MPPALAMLQALTPPPSPPPELMNMLKDARAAGLDQKDLDALKKKDHGDVRLMDQDIKDHNF